jgi:hypothetical protein
VIDSWPVVVCITFLIRTCIEPPDRKWSIHFTDVVFLLNCAYEDEKVYLIDEVSRTIWISEAWQSQNVIVWWIWHHKKWPLVTLQYITSHALALWFPNAMWNRRIVVAM